MRAKFLLFSSLLLAAPAGAQTLIAHLSAGLGTSGGTTAALNTTGANFIVVAVAGVNGNAPTVASSPSNTWVSSASYTSTNTNIQMFYAANATTGASQTFTVTGSFVSACIGAFSGVATTTPLFTSTGTIQANGTTIALPTLTPSGASLLVTGATINGAEATISINQSYVLVSSSPFASGANYGCTLAYLDTSAATNPTWTYAANTDIAADLLSFTAQAVTPPATTSGITFSPGSGRITISPGSGRVTY